MTAQQQWEIPEQLEMWNKVTFHDFLSPKNNVYCFSSYTLCFLTGYVNTSVSLHLLNTCLDKVDQSRTFQADGFWYYVQILFQIMLATGHVFIYLLVYLFIYTYIIVDISWIQNSHISPNSKELKFIIFHLQITILQRNLKPFINDAKLTKLTTVIFLPLQKIKFWYRYVKWLTQNRPRVNAKM